MRGLSWLQPTQQSPRGPSLCCRVFQILHKFTNLLTPPQKTMMLLIPSWSSQIPWKYQDYHHMFLSWWWARWWCRFAKTNPPKLFNGTQFIVRNMVQRFVYANILSGCGEGEDVFIPQIAIEPSMGNLPIPLQLYFVISINYSKGQTLSMAGLHLEKQCFFP